MGQYFYPWNGVTTLYESDAANAFSDLVRTNAAVVRFVRTLSCEIPADVPYIDVPYGRDADVLENLTLLPSDTGVTLTVVVDGQEYDTANTTFILDEALYKDWVFRIRQQPSMSMTAVHIQIPSYLFSRELRRNLFGSKRIAVESVRDAQKLTAQSP